MEKIHQNLVTLYDPECMRIFERTGGWGGGGGWGGWLYWGFNATLTAEVIIIIMAVGDAHVFPGFLTPVLTELFFPKPPTTFLTCICRGERRKYAGKKVRLNQESNS